MIQRFVTFCAMAGAVDAFKCQSLMVASLLPGYASADVTEARPHDASTTSASATSLRRQAGVESMGQSGAEAVHFDPTLMRLGQTSNGAWFWGTTCSTGYATDWSYYQSQQVVYCQCAEGAVLGWNRYDEQECQCPEGTNLNAHGDSCVSDEEKTCGSVRVPAGYLRNRDESTSSVCGTECLTQCFVEKTCGSVPMPAGHRLKQSVSGSTLCGTECLTQCFEAASVTCDCRHGSPATDCTSNGQVKCDTCNAGFVKSGDKCICKIGLVLNSEQTACVCPQNHKNLFWDRVAKRGMKSCGRAAAGTDDTPSGTEIQWYASEEPSTTCPSCSTTCLGYIWQILTQDGMEYMQKICGERPTKASKCWRATCTDNYCVPSQCVDTSLPCKNPKPNGEFYGTVTYQPSSTVSNPRGVPGGKPFKQYEYLSCCLTPGQVCDAPKSDTLCNCGACDGYYEVPNEIRTQCKDCPSDMINVHKFHDLSNTVVPALPQKSNNYDSDYTGDGKCYACGTNYEFKGEKCQSLLSTTTCLGNQVRFGGSGTSRMNIKCTQKLRITEQNYGSYCSQCSRGCGFGECDRIIIDISKLGESYSEWCQVSESSCGTAFTTPFTNTNIVCCN